VVEFVTHAVHAEVHEVVQAETLA
jgi:hypothetical protein